MKVGRVHSQARGKGPRERGLLLGLSTMCRVKTIQCKSPSPTSEGYYIQEHLPLIICNIIIYMLNIFQIIQLSFNYSSVTLRQIT